MSRSLITGMVWIDKHSEVKLFSSRLQSIYWDWFLDVSIKACPLVLLENWHVNVWVGWAKHHSHIVLFLEICKYMEHGFQVSFTRLCHLRCKQRYFGDYVYSPKFNNPMQDTYLWLIVGCESWFEFWGCIEFWNILCWPWRSHVFRQFTSPKVLAQILFSIVYLYPGHICLHSCSTHVLHLVIALYVSLHPSRYPDLQLNLVSFGKTCQADGGMLPHHDECFNCHLCRVRHRHNSGIHHLVALQACTTNPGRPCMAYTRGSS